MDISKNNLSSFTSQSQQWSANKPLGQEQKTTATSLNALTSTQLAASAQEENGNEPIDTGFIYNAFMNGSSGIIQSTQDLNNIIRLGIEVQELQKLGQNIVNSLDEAAATIYQLNSSNPTTSVLFDPTKTQVTIDIGGNQSTIPVNEAIGLYNAALGAIGKQYQDKIYPAAKSKNPDTMLPSELNLPAPLPTLSSTGVNVQGFEAELEPFESSISQLNSVTKNLSLAVSQQYQDLNNAHQGMSSTLKILLSMVMAILNNV